MSAQFKSFLHVALMVEDLDKAIKYWEDLGGKVMGPIVSTGAAGEPAIVNGEVLGDPGHEMCKFVMIDAFGVVLEVIEAGPWGPYHEWVDKHGYGLQHIAVHTGDEENYHALKEKCIAITKNRPLYIDGVWPQTGRSDHCWSYIDMQPEIGTVVEIMSSMGPDEVVTGV